MTKNKMLWYMLIANWLLALLFFVSQAASSWNEMLDSDRITEPWHFWLTLIAFVITVLLVVVPVVVLIIYRKKAKANLMELMEIINKVVSNEKLNFKNLILWIAVFTVSSLLIVLNAIFKVLYPEQTFNWLRIPGLIGAVVSVVVLIVTVLRTAVKK